MGGGREGEGRGRGHNLIFLMVLKIIMGKKCLSFSWLSDKASL